MKRLYLLLFVVPGLINLNAFGWLGGSGNPGTAQVMHREGQVGMRNNGGRATATGVEAGQGALGEPATGTEHTGSTSY